MSKPQQPPPPAQRPKSPLQIRKDELLKMLTRPAFLQLVERSIPQGVPLDPTRLIYQAFHLLCTPDERTGEFKLLACENASIARAVLKAATLGLEFHGQAFLIPYGAQCTFMSSVWGELARVQRTGQLKRCWAEVVYEADEFEIIVGESPKLVHVLTKSITLPGANIAIGDVKAIVKKENGGRGAPLFAYACGELPNGVVIWDYMLEAEMALGRSLAASSNSPAHRNWGDEMRSKMALRRAMKKWPHGAELSKQLHELEGTGRLDDVAERDLAQVIESTVEDVDGRVPTPAAAAEGAQPAQEPAQPAPKGPPAQLPEPSPLGGAVSELDRMLAESRQRQGSRPVPGFAPSEDDANTSDPR
jgi:phage RecT family recombinase